jgi:hypothetical protein
VDAQISATLALTIASVNERVAGDIRADNLAGLRELIYTPPSFRDAPLGAGPESILTIVVMDSGLAALRRPGMTVARQSCTTGKSEKLCPTPRAKIFHFIPTGKSVA